MKGSYKIILVIVAAFFSASAFCQERAVIKGIIVDSATLSRLPFVNVKVKNTLRGTAADARGSFALNASIGDTIVLSMIGYKKLEITLLSKESLLLRLAEQPKVLESVTIKEISTEAYFKKLYDDQFKQLEKSRRKAPFYLSKSKKELRYLSAAEKEFAMAQVFIQEVATNDDLKKSLMLTHDLSEEEYYNILRKFNERSYTFMYYLSAPELLNMVRSFFAKTTAQAN